MPVKNANSPDDEHCGMMDIGQGAIDINQGETALNLPFRLDDRKMPVVPYRRVKVLCCTSRQLEPTMTSNSPGSHT